MKKILALLLALVLLLGLAACTATEAPNDSGDASQGGTAGNGASDGGSSSGGSSTNATAGGTVVETEEYRITLPAGWAVESSNDEFTIYVSADYPENLNNLVIVLTEKDATFTKYTQADMESLYADSMENLAFASFEPETIAGCDAMRLVYTLTRDGTDLTQYQYLVDAPSCTINITFTEVGSDMMFIAQDVIETLEVL